MKFLREFSPLDPVYYDRMATPSSEGENVHQKARKIIEDAFRRADKDDDGCLSLDDFKHSFADSLLSEVELTELFHQIDTHKTNNLDVGELCDYFAQFWAPFEKIFTTVDTANASMTELIHHVAQSYSSQTRYGKFSAKFLMKEILYHLNAIEDTLAMTIQNLEEQDELDRVDSNSSEEEKEKNQIDEENESTPKSDNVTQGSVSKPRWHQKLDQSLNSKSLLDTGDSLANLKHEVSRLSNLINRLETKVILEPVDEEEITPGKEATVLVVSHNIEVPVEKKEEFRETLKHYVQDARTQVNCHYVSVRSFADTCQYIVYEVWRKREHWNSFDKKIESICGQFLAKPIETKDMTIPDSWWPSTIN